MHVLSPKPAHKEPSPSWWVPVLLSLPALIPLAQSIVLAELRSEVATGFMAYDMPAYVANAREHFDQGFRLFYGNPYAGYDTPAIYFQPHIFLLGCMQQLGLDPGLTYNIFGLAALLFAGFVAVRFYCGVVGWKSPADKLGLICFFWGGGVLSLAGLLYACAVRKFNVDSVLHFDLTHGLWMLNFGRNLVYPTEAYYHAVFLFSMLFLIRRRFVAAIGLAALLALSHPFTGLEAVLVVGAYMLIERLMGDRSVKVAHLATCAGLLALHLGYYLVFLNRFADHRILTVQWEAEGKKWLYQLPTFLPALAIVGLLALLRLTRPPGFRQVWRDPHDRLFLVWFVIVFGLTQHFRLMRPVQPLHFAHGYDWMALFLLSVPVLEMLLKRLLRIERFWLGVLAVGGVVLFFLSDNLIWFGTFLSPNASTAVNLTKDQKGVLDWLDRNAVPRDMVVSQDGRISYLVSTYTRVRSWYGHGLNTPWAHQRFAEAQQAFQERRILPAWEAMRVFYIAKHVSEWKPPHHSTEVFQNSGYEIWECPPTVAAFGDEN